MSYTVYNRPGRVGDLIRREISGMLIGEIKDPRIGLVTITKVSMSPDLRHAKVYFSLIGNMEDKVLCREGLQSASGFIRRVLAKRLRLKYIPDMVFEYDDSLEYGNHIEQLLKEVKREETE